MSLFNKKMGILLFFYYSPIFTAVVGVLSVYYSFLLFGAIVNWNLVLMTFFMVFAVYSTNNLIEKDDDKIDYPQKAIFIKKNQKSISIAVIISYTAAIIIGALVNIIISLFLFSILLIGLIYSIKIFHWFSRLKDIVGIKSLTVALTWATSLTFIPSLGLKNLSLITSISIFYFFFVKCFITTILADIRDIKGDKKNGIKTIPIVIGKTQIQILLTILTLTIIPLILILSNQGLSYPLSTTMTFTIINTILYIYYTHKNKINNHFIRIWVQGEWFITITLYLLLTYHLKLPL